MKDYLTFGTTIFEDSFKGPQHFYNTNAYNEDNPIIYSPKFLTN